MYWLLWRWKAKVRHGKEFTDDYDDGMQQLVMEMECTGDYGDGTQELDMEMEYTDDYDDGI